MRRNIPIEIFSRYDINPETGAVWDKLRQRYPKFGKSEYRSIYFEGHSYALHRVVFFFCTGTQPDYVDHIDRNTKHNWFNNLRASNNSFNVKNLDRRVKYVTGKNNTTAIRSRRAAYIKGRDRNIARRDAE